MVVNDGTVASNLAHAIVEVVDVNASAPTVDLDGDNTTLPGTSYHTTFTENGHSRSRLRTPIPSSAIPISAARYRFSHHHADEPADRRSADRGPAAADHHRADSSVPGVITLSDIAPFADYETALEAIRFSAAGDNPVAGTRIIQVVVNDGTFDSQPATSFVTVVAVNDAPVNTVPAAQSVAEDTILPIAGVSVADIDSSALTTTLNRVANGILNVTAGAGVSGNGSASVSIAGTAAQINAALAGLAYTGNLNFNGGDIAHGRDRRRDRHRHRHDRDHRQSSERRPGCSISTPDTLPTTRRRGLIVHAPSTDGVVRPAVAASSDTDRRSVIPTTTTSQTLTSSDDGITLTRHLDHARTTCSDCVDYDASSFRARHSRMPRHDTPVTGRVLTLTIGTPRSLLPLSIRTASLAARRSAFANTGTNPSTETRIIDVVVNDGTVASNLAHAIVEVTQVNNSAPTLDLDGNNTTLPGTSYRTTFTENGPPVAIADTDTLIGDPDIGSTIRFSHHHADEPADRRSADRHAAVAGRYHRFRLRPGHRNPDALQRRFVCRLRDCAGGDPLQHGWRQSGCGKPHHSSRRQ